MICSNCGLPIDEGKWVKLDGFPLHVEACFAAALRPKAQRLAELAIELAQTMQPEVAYSAGKTYVATIVGERRKAKGRRAPVQQAFSVANFAGKRR